MSSCAPEENEAVLDPSGTASTLRAGSAFESRRARREREEQAALDMANSSGVADLADESTSAAPTNTEFLSRRDRRIAAQHHSDGLAAASLSVHAEQVEAQPTRRARRRKPKSTTNTPAGEETIAVDSVEAARESESEAVVPAADTAELVDAVSAEAPEPFEVAEPVVVAEPVEAHETVETTEPDVVEPDVVEPEVIETADLTEAEVAEPQTAEPVVAESAEPEPEAEIVPEEVPTTTESFEEIIAGAFPIDESSVADDTPAEEDERSSVPKAADEARGAASDPRRGRHGVSSATPVEEPRSPRSIRRIAAKAMTVSALLAVGLMTVATSVPANALLSADDVQAQKRQALVEGTYASGDAQSMVNTASADVSMNRDTYSALSVKQTAVELGIDPEGSFTNDPNGTVQWPFPVGVHIGSGYGSRPGCSIGCSTNHKGQDFNPGYGAPIQSIADGVVVESTDAGGGFGVKIVIEHVIDGQMIHSLYGHMIHGSRAVQVGDHVSVGQIIGKTGSTGISTGAHLHFEILINGTRNVDPLAWLYENTN